MTGLRARVHGRPLVALTAMLLGGCISNGLKSNQPVTQLYVLHGPANAGGAAPLATVTGTANGTADGASHAPSEGVTLEVMRPGAAAGLDTDGIALQRPGNRLDYYAGSRWATTAPLQLQQLALDALAASGRFGAVEPAGTPFVADELLRIQLRHFEAVYGDDGPPTVRVTLVCTLGARSGRRLLGTFTAESRVPAAANRMQAVVAAFERATNAALAQLVARWPGS